MKCIAGVVELKPKRFFMSLSAIFLLFFASGESARVLAAVFVPEQPVLAANKLRVGDKGYLLTVMKGLKPVRLPLEVVSVVSASSKNRQGRAENSILVRTLGSIAQGMSGSPVFIGGKLVGALSSGWNFGDHRVGLVTPIGEMIDIFSYKDRPMELKNAGHPLSSPVIVGGLSESAVEKMSGFDGLSGVSFMSLPSNGGELPLERARFAPGDAIAALLVWGDVEAAAVGTVTATSKDGRFLAFGHPFLGRGAVNFPVGRAFVHDVIDSRVFPFKLATPVSILGTATQDRSAGIGGQAGYFTPSIAATLAFQDLDDLDKSGRVPAHLNRSFRVTPDAFLAPLLLEGMYGGLITDLWGRKGQGTASVSLRVDGRGLMRGWTRKNMFFSDSSIETTALKESTAIISAFLKQPFSDISPIGFRLEVSITQEPKILFIEDVLVSQDAKPGDTLGVDVTLRPYRAPPVKKRFDLIIPNDAEGTCELVVRSGSEHPLSQLAVDEGWKSIDGFERFLSEAGAGDANNELIVELNCDRPLSKITKTASADAQKPQMLPEEKEYLSETKARRIKEGTLRVFRSDYVVDGMMKRVVTLATDKKSEDDSDEK
ncbi:hypothetical protein AGMMS49957_04780 [Synergistales bacterium]|nr:hypothetical protein AGMMS49957_04780 [Synergistales bacterium]